MSAPTPTARATPAGIKLKDGFPIKVTIAADTNIELWEKSVQPPGISIGDKIDQTTQFNEDYETFAPPALKSLSDGGGKCAYDPTVLSSIEAIIGQETTITYTFPDGSTWAIFGYLAEWTPDALDRGQQPEASFKIVFTNWDYVGKVEAGPAVASVAGT